MALTEIRGGEELVRWLDHRIFGLGLPPRLDPLVVDALESVIAEGEREEMLGLGVDGIDEVNLAALRRAGVPIAMDEGIVWEREVIEDPRLERPEDRGATLALPPCRVLAGCNGVELKPLRTWFGRATGLRLQAAPGIAWFLWPHQALLISTREERLAGFLHGPGADQRHSIAWEPGSARWIRW